MRQVHVQRPIADVLQLVAMAGGSKDAVRLEAGAHICWQHESSDAGDPDGRQVAKDSAGQGEVMQRPCKLCRHASLVHGCQDTLPLCMDDRQHCLCRGQGAC